jgi:hypothetical protein
MEVRKVERPSAIVMEPGMIPLLKFASVNLTSDRSPPVPLRGGGALDRVWPEQSDEVPASLSFWIDFHYKPSFSHNQRRPVAPVRTSARVVRQRRQQ